MQYYMLCLHTHTHSHTGGHVSIVPAAFVNTHLVTCREVGYVIPAYLQ
jgi:hypothetical protein